MIPEIKDILLMFRDGNCTLSEALEWIDQHILNAEDEVLRWRGT